MTERGAGVPRLLVVDDEAGIHRAVARILAPRYAIVSAYSAEEALAVAGASSFDVALVDVRMPGEDGFSCLRRLRAAHPDVDVILMTGSVDESDEKLVRSLREDAYFFLLKPFERGVLEALLDRCLSARATRRALRDRVQELESELRQARDLQRSLHPAPLPAGSRFRATVSFRPCLAVGGDLYDWHAFSPSRLLVLLADVSGHGVSAAMITAMLKASFDRLTAPAPPSEVLGTLRAGLMNLEADRFVTAIVADLDAEKGTLVYASAGHGAALLVRRDGTLARLERTGRFLSAVVPPALGDSPPIPFAPGDRFVAYTDGAPEMMNPGGERFGEPRLENALRDATGGDLSPIIERLDRFRDGRPADDDETIVSVSRVGEDNPLPRSSPPALQSKMT